jgi:hypothetical protein
MPEFDTARGHLRNARALTLAGVLVGLSAISACSSSSSSSSSSAVGASTPTPSTRPTTTSSPASVRSTSDAATITTIKLAYRNFFNPATPLSKAVTLLQNGTAFTESLRKQAGTPLAKATTVTVSKVTRSSDDTATVLYTLLLSGKPLLVDTVGAAVRERGTWKVADVSFCALLAAQGTAPAACSATATNTAPH